eukprot:3279073-Pyramimonas_sp.AAC.3
MDWNRFSKDKTIGSFELLAKGDPRSLGDDGDITIDSANPDIKATMESYRERPVYAISDGTGQHRLNRKWQAPCDTLTGIACDCLHCLRPLCICPGLKQTPSLLFGYLDRCAPSR